MHFNPWQALSQREHLTLRWQDSEEDLGHFEFHCGRVTLTEGMSQAERRCTLTHELIHEERGPFAEADREREERIVEDMTARRLIPIAALIDGLCWSYGEAELADHLWVDERTIVTRLRNLTPAETKLIDAELDRREASF